MSRFEKKWTIRKEGGLYPENAPKNVFELCFMFENLMKILPKKLIYNVKQEKSGQFLCLSIKYFH